MNPVLSKDDSRMTPAHKRFPKEGAYLGTIVYMGDLIDFYADGITIFGRKGDNEADAWIFPLALLNEHANDVVHSAKHERDGYSGMLIWAAHLYNRYKGE